MQEKLAAESYAENSKEREKPCTGTPSSVEVNLCFVLTAG
jgi:hypothetical protein